MASHLRQVEDYVNSSWLVHFKTTLYTYVIFVDVMYLNPYKVAPSWTVYMLNKNTQGAKKGEANQKQQLSSR